MTSLKRLRVTRNTSSLKCIGVWGVPNFPSFQKRTVENAPGGEGQFIEMKGKQEYESSYPGRLRRDGIRSDARPRYNERF
jgi:hypothetical protein